MPNPNEPPNIEAIALAVEAVVNRSNAALAEQIADLSRRLTHLEGDLARIVRLAGVADPTGIDTKIETRLS